MCGKLPIQPVVPCLWQPLVWAQAVCASVFLWEPSGAQLTITGPGGGVSGRPLFFGH